METSLHPRSLGPSADLIEGVIRELRIITRTATLEFALAVGQVIVDGFYGGDLDAWRSRGAKDVSFRKLAKHPDLPMSPTALYRSVSVYELSRRLPIEHWQRVSPSHLHAVLPLSQDEQERLLEMTELQSWPVRRLREEVAKLEQQPSFRDRGGRKRSASLIRTIHVLEGCLDGSGNLVGAAEASFAPSCDATRETLRVLRAVRCACASLEEALLSACARESDIRSLTGHDDSCTDALRGHKAG
jgi:hypothetical protein